MSYISLNEVSRFYKMGDHTIYANKDITFTIEKGELVVILGASGAGKSTLLNILGGMDQADQGQVLIDGQDITHFNSKQLTVYRRENVGFVFQFYNLVPNLTAKENVELAVELVRQHRDPSEALADVGLKERQNHFPSQLSGGEQQRVSIARALAKSPKLLLCDEPTGALDYQTGKQVLTLLQDLAHTQATTVIIVTHNSALASMADRVIHLHDAKVESITVNAQPVPIANIDY
ncbi:ABC transporter ATP-binding protein [Streptococcus halichoeri]|uniref:ABC transporter ATP-binding protein n=1 Tax=Streptococcus halichoeri TaxID=254785 RepID=UPI00191753A0|nr:ABC transporter ATP-binding protein [Streptococcus halichoeri]